MYQISREAALKIEAAQRVNARFKIRRTFDNYGRIVASEAEETSEAGQWLRDRIQMLESLDAIKSASPEDFGST